MKPLARLRAWTAGEDGRRRVREAAALLLFFAACAVYYAFVASAGHWKDWPNWTSFLDGQAEGFRSGHLYSAKPVPDEIRALEDPFEKGNGHFWPWDYSYYGGHLHLYWGLVPSALLAAFKVLFRMHVAVGDQVIVFFALMLRVVAGTLLLRALARRMQPRPPTWAVWLSAKVFAFANPTPFLLARAAVYETAIASGVAFATTGVLLCLLAMDAPDGRRARAWLAAASLSLGLAAGSRISLAPAITLTAALAILYRWRVERGRYVSAGLAGAVPLSAVMLIHFVCNHLRYGKWSEFGAKYQFTWPPLKMGLRYVAANVYIYLFRHIVRSCTFPFLKARYWEAVPFLPSWIVPPKSYSGIEPTIGLLVASPWIWLALGLVIAALVTRARRRRDLPTPAPDTLQRWIVAMLVVLTAAAAFPVLLMWLSSMRYSADFSPWLLILASLGAWRLLALPSRRAGRVAVAALVVGLGVFTIVVGVLLGFTGYFDHFKLHNPQLYDRLVGGVHVCFWRR
jgi:hypothetical protein